MDSSAILADIVKSAHQFSTTLQLGAFLDHLLNHQQLDPSSRKALLIGMQKIGCYSSASLLLFCSARKFKTFRKISTKVIKLPEEAIRTIDKSKSSRSLVGVLQRLDKGATLQIDQLCETLGRFAGITPEKAQNEYDQLVRTALGSTIIHAEIQIPYHYELHPVPLAPRVICSSKSACFLCDLFLRHHGKCYMPRTHGKLYEKWRLPAIQDLKLSHAQKKNLVVVFQKFNAEMESRIISMLKSRRRLSHLYPNESVYLQTPSWTPSRVSDADQNTSIVEQSSGNGCDDMMRISTISSQRTSDTSTLCQRLVQGRKHRWKMEDGLYLIHDDIHLFLDGPKMQSKDDNHQRSENTTASKAHVMEIE
jgi:hypothetical protein